MQDPQERASETRVRDTGLIPLDSFDQAGLEPLPDPAPPYMKEPLFNKKVMALWALGALAVWFAFTVVAPIVFESTRTAVREAMKEAATNSEGTITIHRSRDGKVYTITREPNKTITVRSSEEPAPPAPAPEPAAPPSAAGKAPPAKR